MTTSARVINWDGLYAQSAAVMSRDIGGEAVLLNLDSGTYFGLNAVGTRTWALIGEGKSPAQVLAAIVQEYAVATSQAEQDLQKLFSDLLQAGLLVEQESAP
jgi:hypothetical protein